jgi:hypothetical protein
MSEIEKRIIHKHENFDKRKKVPKTEDDFKWWHFDDHQTYFVLTTKRKNVYKKGD